MDVGVQKWLRVRTRGPAGAVWGWSATSVLQIGVRLLSARIQPGSNCFLGREPAVVRNQPARMRGPEQAELDFGPRQPVPRDHRPQPERSLVQRLVAGAASRSGDIGAKTLKRLAREGFLSSAGWSEGFFRRLSIPPLHQFDEPLGRVGDAPVSVTGE